MSEIKKQWYVVRAIGGKEGKVKEYIEAEIRHNHLEDYISQVLIPTEKVYTIRNGKKVSKEKVSYPGYVLVEAAFVGQIPIIIRNTPNVLGFLGDTKEDSRKMNATPLRPQEVARILPIFIVGFLFVSISRVTTAFFYAVNQNVRAYLLIYGEPLLLLLLLLVLPAAIGIQGTWLAVPISQIITAAASLLLIWKEKQHTTKTALTDSQNS